MLKKLLTKAPVWAVLVAVLVFVIVASAALGLEWPLLVALATTIFAVAEGGALWALQRRNAQNERHFRQIRFVADRLQSMVRSMPGGYCLFTPQGMLREEHGVGDVLKAEKISHLDDLIGAVKEGPDLLGAFRRLQLSGEPFTMGIHALKGGKEIHVVGNQFRIGGTGPVVDVLWFCDYPRVMMQQATAAATAATMAHAHSSPHEAPIIVPAPVEATPRHAVNLGTCFDILPFPVWARDKELKLVMCNTAYAASLDASVEAVLAEQMELAPSSSKGGRHLAEEALKSGETQSERDHVVVKGKRCLLQMIERPTHSRPTFVLEQDKEHAVALLGIALDVTAEEEKETELRRHLVSHHEVMEHLGSAICVYGADMRLDFYNRAYQWLWEAP